MLIKKEIMSLIDTISSANKFCDVIIGIAQRWSSSTPTLKTHFRSELGEEAQGIGNYYRPYNSEK